MPTEDTKPADVTPPPSAPVESPAVTANQSTELPQPAPAPAKKAAAKKTAAKKAAPRKAAAKKAAAEPTPAEKAAATRAKAEAAPEKRDPNARASESNRKTPTEVAEEIVAGSRKWLSGRERDILLAEAGYDLDEMRREVQLARVRKMQAEA